MGRRQSCGFAESTPPPVTVTSLYDLRYALVIPAVLTESLAPSQPLLGPYPNLPNPGNLAPFLFTGGPNPLLVVAAFGCGIVWSFLRYRTGRLAPAVISHAIFSWAIVEFPIWHT